MIHPNYLHAFAAHMWQQTETSLPQPEWESCDDETITTHLDQLETDVGEEMFQDAQRAFFDMPPEGLPDAFACLENLLFPCEHGVMA